MRKEKHILYLLAALMGVVLYASVLTDTMAHGGHAAPAQGTVTDFDGYVSDAEIMAIADLPRDGRAAEAYKAFAAEGAYYSAFAIAPDGGYGWADNHATQANADASALAWCRDVSQGCRIVARIAPKVQIEIDGQPLSKTAGEGANQYQTLPGAKAFALSDLGDWGVAWDHYTRADAVADAMASCRAFLAEDASGQQHQGTCRLIWAD